MGASFTDNLGVNSRRISTGLFTRTVYEASVIFANIQISFPHHVSTIRLGLPGNKYVSLIVPGRPIRKQRFSQL